MSLPEIASELRAGYGAFKTKREHWGKLLCDAKKQLPHGSFMKWLEQETGIPYGTAYDWMRLVEPNFEIFGIKDMREREDNHQGSAEPICQTCKGRGAVGACKDCGCVPPEPEREAERKPASEERTPIERRGIDLCYGCQQRILAGLGSLPGCPTCRADRTEREAASPTPAKEASPPGKLIRERNQKTREDISNFDHGNDHYKRIMEALAVIDEELNAWPDMGKPVELEYPEIPPELDTPEFQAALDLLMRFRREKRMKGFTPTGLRMKFKEWSEWGVDRAIAAINHSVKNEWDGIYEERKSPHGSQSPGIRQNTLSEETRAAIEAKTIRTGEAVDQQGTFKDADIF